MKTKLILFKGGVETQEFFSFELARYFRKMGYEIFFYDFMNEQQSFMDMTDFYEMGNTVMFTFNFHGLEAEPFIYDTHGISYWQRNQIPVFNMVLDHPYYYHKYIPLLPDNYHQISIDRLHRTYMKRYFPDLDSAAFIPLGGTQLRDREVMPMEERPIDIVFTGNYTRPETFEKYIKDMDQEYIHFYHTIIDELIQYPSRTLEEVAERRMKEEIGRMSDRQMRDCYPNMIFIDLWVRFTYREKAVRALVDSGHQVHTFGAGWNALSCKHPENLIQGGGVNSRKCLEMIAQSKISLNVMPWFKDGAHDRIFNSMLNGAVSLTDESKYLKEVLQDSKNVAFYQLENMDRIGDIVDVFLNDKARLKEMAECGYQQAKTVHTWKNRAEQIQSYILRCE